MTAASSKKKQCGCVPSAENPARGTERNAREAMRLVTIQRAGRARPGVLVGNDILDLVAARDVLAGARLLPPSLRAILEAGEPALDLILRLIDQTQNNVHRLRECDALVAYDKATLLAPIGDPGMLLSCGMNYGEHLREMNTPVPEKPIAFCKSVTAIIGHREPILLPKSNPDMVDWEGEFSAVIGRTCFAVKAEEAYDYVAGYTIVNDVSARDWVAPVFKATGVMGPIHAWDHNILGKQFPTFAPMGPVLVTKDEIRDPNDLQLTTRLNGAVMQSAHTSDLVFDVARLIAYYSQFYRFQAGDVITTGSPSGVGFGRDPKIFMRPGDRIEVEVNGIGVLSNPIASTK
jgi:2-keto-4-pentenoate hydratase/2-oxohepta-3-ene-1,7-dioic acid hydratase in catechol pathway